MGQIRQILNPPNFPAIRYFLSSDGRCSTVSSTKSCRVRIYILVVHACVHACAGVTCQNRKWLNMSRPDFTCFLTRFFCCRKLGEANTLQDNKRLCLFFSPLYTFRLNYCSFVRETAVFDGYAKRFSAARESCVHAIAFRVMPIDSPYCDTKPTYHGILR